MRRWYVALPAASMTLLIGSELPGLTRVRSASGVYPAVTALDRARSDGQRRLSATETIVTYGADWTEYGAHVVDAAPRRNRVFRSIRCGRRPPIDCGRHRLLCAVVRLARRRRCISIAMLADTITHRAYLRGQRQQRRGL